MAILHCVSMRQRSTFGVSLIPPAAASYKRRADLHREGRRGEFHNIAAALSSCEANRITPGASPSKSRRAALAGSPSIVEPRSGAGTARCAPGGVTVTLRHAAHTSAEVAIQLMDAGDRGERQ